MTPLIRPATHADLAAISAIYAHHVLHGTASFETDPPDLAEITRRFDDITRRDLPYLTAEIDGAVRGYAYAGPYRPRPAYRFTVEDSIYIDHDFHRRGIGNALLAALIEACRERPVRQIVAIIGDSANHASIRLHEQHGFRHVGTLENVGRKFDCWLDTVLMQLSLI